MSRKGETGVRVTRVTSTWLLLGLAAPGGLIFSFIAQMRLENTYSPCRGFISGTEGNLESELVFVGQKPDYVRKFSITYMLKHTGLQGGTLSDHCMTKIFKTQVHLAAN